MKRILLITAMASLAACKGGHYQYDMVQVEGNFQACMNSTPPASDPVSFDHKVSSCKESAYATVPEKFVK